MTTALSASGKPNPAAEELFREALKLYKDRPELDPTKDRKSLEEFARCTSTDDIMLALEKRIDKLKYLRDDGWAKHREKLKLVVDVASRLTTIVGDAAQFIGIPGEKGVFAAFGLLLAATQAQRARYDALETLLEQLNSSLLGFNVLYDETPSQHRPRLDQIATTILAHLFYVLALSTKFLRKGRIRHYLRAFIGLPDDLKGALQKMDDLTMAEERMTAEHTLLTVEDNLAATERLHLPVERSMYPHGDPNIEPQLLTTPTSALSATTPSKTEVAPSAQVHIFQEASDVTMANSQINISNVQYGTTPTSKGMDLLLAHCSLGALLDSEERFDPPRCDEDTRKEVIAQIMRWIGSTDESASMMVLHGSAGVGKSALEQAIAELCSKNGHRVASFFFSRSLGGRRADGNSLIPTLIYQLRNAIPGLQEYVLSVLDANPGMFERSRAVQMEQLFIMPQLAPMFNRACFDWVPPSPQTSPILIAIDGLDECSNDKIQCDLLSIIAAAIPRLPLPFRFLIACRPEFHIMDTLNHHPSLKAIDVQRFDLNSIDADADIRLFFTKEFRKIRETHRICQYLSEYWPTDAVIATLTRNSSGQFIYASVVMNYLNHPKERPDRRLEVILGLSPARVDEKPFAQLDALYSHIFSCVRDIDLVWRILGIIRLYAQSDIRGLDHHHTTFTTPATLNMVLLLRPGDVELALDELASIIVVPSGEGPIQILHASLMDFLLDPIRSGEYALDLGLAHETLSKWIISKSSGMVDTVQTCCDFLYHCHHSRSLSDEIFSFSCLVSSFLLLLLDQEPPCIGKDSLDEALRGIGYLCDRQEYPREQWLIYMFTGFPVNCGRPLPSTPPILQAVSQELLAFKDLSHEHQECQIDVAERVHQVIAAARFTNWTRNFRQKPWLYSNPSHLNHLTPCKWDGQTRSDPIVEAITMRFSHVSIPEATSALSLLAKNISHLLPCPPPGLQGETKILDEFHEDVFKYDRKSEFTIDDFIKPVHCFRLLVVGRSGVGKSSLINRVFGITNAHVAHFKAGESDIQQEFVSNDNPFYVLHDSNGFEPGDVTAFETVRQFIMERSKQELKLKDRVHALWLCTETPTAGGRVFEPGDEKLLKLAHEIQIPIVIVFTQYDRLVMTKEHELQEDSDEILDPATLKARSKEEARKAFEVCVESLRRTMDRLKIPMSHYVKFSVRPGYQEDVSALLEVTQDIVKERLKEDAWWAIVQRASLPVKIEACITKGMSYYRRILTGSVPGFGQILLRNCLTEVHKDIVSCWNLNGTEILNSDEFEQIMLYLVQDVHPETYISTRFSRLNLERISQFVRLVTACPPIAPPAAILGLEYNFMEWLANTVLENTPSIQRFLIAYIVDLIGVLRELFDFTLKANLTLTTTWPGLREAFQAYERSDCRQRIHKSICSRPTQREQIVTADGISEKVRDLVREYL